MRERNQVTSAVGRRASEPTLGVVVAAVREVARRPAAVLFCATTMLLSHLLLRAGGARLRDELLATVLWGDPPSAGTIGLFLAALLVSTLWCCAGLSGALAATLGARGSLAPRRLLAGIASLPAVCAVLVCSSLAIVALGLAGLLCVERASTFAAPGSLSRAMLVALGLAPTIAGVCAIALAALLSISRLARSDKHPASTMSRGVAALVVALFDLLASPARTTGLVLSSILVTSPLLLLALVASVVALWIEPLQASVALKLVQCLALAAGLLVTATALNLALGQEQASST